MITFGVIVLNFYPVGGYLQLNLFQGEAPKKTPKILSFNVRLFDLYNWSDNIATRNQIFEFLKTENASVMCFQEFYHQKNSKKFPTKDTLKKIFPNFQWHEKYTHEMRDEQFFGVVTMSRFPILNRGEVAFNNDPNNFCIYSDLLVNNDTVRIYNAHIGSIRFQESDYSVFDDQKDNSSGKEKQAIASRLSDAFQKRQTQAGKIIKSMRSSPHPTMICGDFNDTPFSYVYRIFHEFYNDAFRISGFGMGKTYIGKAPSYRIDYIFHDPSINTFEFITYDINRSDHRPISARFRLN